MGIDLLCTRMKDCLGKDEKKDEFERAIAGCKKRYVVDYPEWKL